MVELKLSAIPSSSPSVGLFSPSSLSSGPERRGRALAEARGCQMLASCHAPESLSHDRDAGAAACVSRGVTGVTMMMRVMSASIQCLDKSSIFQWARVTPPRSLTLLTKYPRFQKQILPNAAIISPIRTWLSMCRHTKNGRAKRSHYKLYCY